MKKILMIVVVMMAALSSYAQEMYLGGGISLWRDCYIFRSIPVHFPVAYKA